MIRRKRIDLLSPPYSGHLHPILCMARILSQSYQVRVLSTPGAQERIRAAGVEGIEILPGADATLRNISNPPHAVGSNPLRLHRQFRAALQLFARIRAELAGLYQTNRPDLLIGDFTVASMGVVAEELGIPWWTSLPSPCVLETKDGPPAYQGGLKPATGWLSAVRNHLGRQTIRCFKRSIFFWYRRHIRAIGWPHLYRGDGSETIYSPRCIVALGLEAFEFPRTWPASVRFVGPMLYTPPLDLPGPEFAPERRHVLVTLGTHLAWRKARFASDVAEVARKMPEVVFHFSDGEPSNQAASVANNFHRLPFIDYERYIERYDLVVHHGGAGIMYYCLRHGVPAVVYPVDYDQFDHASRLEAAGLAVWLRHVDDLESTIRSALDNRQLAEQCRSFRGNISSDASATRLLSLVDDCLEH
jgi:UDP:flavonoid glycosyltransferase YjiC (YdhE family)